MSECFSFFLKRPVFVYLVDSQGFEGGVAAKHVLFPLGYYDTMKRLKSTFSRMRQSQNGVRITEHLQHLSMNI